MSESRRKAVALITGASSGIGEATAKRLAREPGAELVLVARREVRQRCFCAHHQHPRRIAGLTPVRAPAVYKKLQSAHHA